MAIIALQSASTGLSALSTKLDVISNNLANVNTVGYKSGRVNFQDLLYIERAQPGVESGNGDERPTGLYVGLGVKVSGTQQSFEQGAPQETGRPLDVMIEGRGFFQVEIEPDRGGGTAYTRAGNFTTNSDGELVLANSTGRRLIPNITIDDDTQAVEILADGRVMVLAAGDTEPTEAGQIELAVFVNPTGLTQIGENLWTESGASGPPITGNPLESNFGKLHAGFLELSNVDPTRELVDLILTQRAFEMNSQALQAADESLRTIGQLRR